MNPQKIVYIGLGMVAVGIFFSAWNPLEPIPYPAYMMDTLDIYEKGEIIYDEPVLLNQTKFWKHEIIGETVDGTEIYRQTFHGKDGNLDMTQKTRYVLESRYINCMDGMEIIEIDNWHIIKPCEIINEVDIREFENLKFGTAICTDTALERAIDCGNESEFIDLKEIYKNAPEICEELSCVDIDLFESKSYNIGFRYLLG